MVIVINTTTPNGFDGEPFIISIFDHLALLNGQHQFVFITASEKLKSADNFIILKNNPSNSKGILNKIKYQYELKRAIKKFLPDILITPFFIQGLKSSTKQYLLAGQTELQKAGDTLMKNLKKISGFITPSSSWGALLISKGVASDDVIILRPFADYLQSAKNKIDLNDGPYDSPFLLLIESNPDPNRIVSILKAFSGFKKRLKSSMKLLIPVSDDKKTALENLLKSYKYRNDVSLLSVPNLENLSTLVSKSYGVIINSDEYGFTNPTPTIISSGAVVIASNSIYNNVKDYTGNNAFYYNKGNFDELLDILFRLYKDEELRNRFVYHPSKEASDQQKMEQLEVLSRKLLLT